MFELNDDGVLLQDGEPVELNGEPVKLDGYLSQTKVDTVVSERLAREKASVAEQIKTLESQANRTPQLEKMLEEARGKLSELERQAANATASAEKEVAARLERSEKRAKQFEEALEAEKAARVQEQVANRILGTTKDKWIDPASDLVPKLMATHKREIIKGEDGKPDAYEDLFEVESKDDKGNALKEFLPVGDAIAALEGREEFQHYLRASERGGAGTPGSRTLNTANMKRSQMSPEDKASYVHQHGVEAFKNLPE